MVLSRLTKITGPGIRTDTNWVGNNANYTGILTAASLGGIGNLNSTGIITAASFSGDGSGLIGVASTDNIVTGTAATFNTYPVDINAGMTVAGVATFSGNVSIAGTLTYEDVTNIDSVGLVTARTGFVSPYADIDDFVDVGSNIQLGNAGVITATTFKGNGDFVELDVDGHTNLDNVSIAGVTTGGGFKTAGTSSDAGATNGFTAGRINIYDNNSHNIFRIGTSPSFAPTVWQTSAITFTTSSFSITNTQSTREYINISNSTGILKLGYGGVGSTHGFKFETSAKGITVGTGVTIETNGQATFVGIVTFGSSSTTINGNTDTINVGTALTIGHSQGLQYHTQNLHAQGFEVNQINASGIITATSFSGDGSNLTGIDVGGNNAISLNDNVNLNIGTGNDGSLFNSGSYIFLKNHNGSLAIQASSGGVISLQKYNNSDIGLQYVVDGKIQLNYDNVSMLETESRGAFVKKGDGGDTTFTVGSTDASGVRICLDGDSNGDAYGNDYAFLQHDTSGDFIISADNPAGNSNLIFKSGNSTERLRIDSTGRISAGKHGVGTYNDASEWLKVQSNDTAANISIVGSNDTHSSLNLGDEDDFNIQKIRSDHTDNKLQFYTNNTERLILQNGGVLSQRVGTYARFSRGILEITTSSTPSQIKITTNLPYSGSSSHAESVTIRGFRYGGRDTVELQICWHVYANQFYNRIASSSGGWAPLITLGVENNKVVIHMDSLGYWPKIYVADYYSSFNSEAYAKGWSWSDSAISGDSGTPVNTVPYKNDWGGLEYNSDHAVGTNPDRHLNIKNGNLIIGTNGHGIDFSASSHASGQTSELFDDYEEGSWTPAYSRPNMTLSHGYQQGFYTKVGRAVHVVGRLYTTSESGGSSGGPILVTGLPFTVREVRCALSLRPSQWSNDHPSFATFELNQTHFELLEEVEGNPSGSQDLGGGRFAGGNGNYLWFSGTYFTDT